MTTVTGFYTFLHHDEPIGWTWDLNRRVGAINQSKPEHERPTRLRCIVGVDEALLPLEFVRVARACGQALVAYDKVLKAYQLAVYQGGLADDGAQEACDQTWAAYLKAAQTYVKVEWTYRKPLLELALKLVPDAPWSAEYDCLVFD